MKFYCVLCPSDIFQNKEPLKFQIFLFISKPDVGLWCATAVKVGLLPVAAAMCLFVVLITWRYMCQELCVEASWLWLSERTSPHLAYRPVSLPSQWATEME